MLVVNKVLKDWKRKMPYIAQKDRNRLDNTIDELIGILKGSENDGNVNYTITRILNGAFSDRDGEWRYASLARAIGCVECVKLEMYRRQVAPYEDLAVYKNGDILEYQNS